AARRAGLHQALAATEWDRRASVALGEPLDAPALGLRLRGAPEQRRRAGVLGPESLRVHLDPPPGLDDPEDLAGVGVDVHNVRMERIQPTPASRIRRVGVQVALRAQGATRPP